MWIQDQLTTKAIHHESFKDLWEYGNPFIMLAHLAVELTHCTTDRNGSNRVGWGFTLSCSQRMRTLSL